MIDPKRQKKNVGWPMGLMWLGKGKGLMCFLRKDIFVSSKHMSRVEFWWFDELL